MLQGIDISHYQNEAGPVDLVAAKADGAEFCIAKASQGKSYKDPNFKPNFLSAIVAGMVPGAYHFFSGLEVPSKEADNFLSQVYAVWQPGELGLFALDLEWPQLRVEEMPSPPRPPVYFERAREFLRIVEHDLKRQMIIYTQASFWAACGNPQGFQSRPLWVARYTTRPDPGVPAGWQDWAIWQYKGDAKGFVGEIDGITGAVDLNRFKGTRAELEALAGGADVVEPRPDALTDVERETIESAISDINRANEKLRSLLGG